MALIKCPECKKKISDRASICIHCGCPISPMLEKENEINPTEKNVQVELTEDAHEVDECIETHSVATKKKLKIWHKVLIIGATIVLLVFTAVALFGGFSNSDESSEKTREPSSSASTDNDDNNVGNNTNQTDTQHPDNLSKESFISNGHFTFSARSFIKLFDEADKDAKKYNYTYMRMNGEASLFYELAEISGGYEKVRSAGMVSFVKGIDTTLSIEEDYTENIITKINVLVEDVDDVPPILVGCMCAADPTMDFTTAYNLGMDVVEKAGTKDGYVHNGIKYVVVADGEYYFIIISIDKNPNSGENSENNTANKDNETTGDTQDNQDDEDNDSTDGTNKLTVSSTNVSLNNSSQVISITVPDNYDGDVSCTVNNSDILSTSWGGWSENTVTLTLIPNATGNTSIEIYLENGDSVVVNVSVSVTDYSPNAADYTTLRIAPATYYTFNDDEGYSSDIVLLESANYKISDNGDGTVNITISGTMQRKTNNISTYIQIGYSLYVDGEDIKSGTVGIDAPNLNQSYSYTLKLDGLQPGNYIIYFTSY